MKKNSFDVEALRLSVGQRMDERRLAHTLGVEREAEALGRIYLPDMVDELRCAALLHDITKNETVEKQLQYCAEFGIIMRGSAKNSPKLLHARTAAEVIRREYPDYATENIVSAVRWHTTGRDGMSVFDMLIYLADYIEDTRPFEDCILLRKYFWDNYSEEMSERQRLNHLCRTAVMSVDMTLRGLMEENAYIDEDTVSFRNYCLREIGI